ncbi:FAD-dependent oxidoreductase [Sphingorhabdus lacus]|uniref:FAD-dependent oxidoreductase n=1 Tax=Sphingorhabdus lacus TaxID=392610 RepID=A0A6I6L9L4_9SPHN|nr:FAD-dependent oxidoreductase [Sphingorhabdus lacus]QGY79252.1 FAD-dependent oxidoreductase [Sphingorhabdus lacus]
MIDAGDVLIVGAGPVGLFTALALAQEGVRVTVIEGEPSISDAPRAIAYFPVVMAALKKLGVLEDLDREGYHFQTVFQKAPALDFSATLSFKVLEGITYDYQIQAGQDVAARIACEHAVRHGVQVLFGHRVVSMEQHSDNVITIVDTPEGPRTLQSKWLIGCDGARSTVRKSLDIPYEGFTWPNRFVATNVYCDFTSLGFADGGFVCDPVYMAVISIINPQGLYRLTYQEDSALPAETFMERLPERYAFHIPEGVKHEIVAARPYTIHQRCASRLRDGRILLAGDAAHCTNPMGGLGLTTGFWDGMVLADVLAAVVRGEEDDSILDRYSDERRRVYLEISSPAASENKRMMEEADPVRRRQDCDNYQRMADSPELTRLAMCFPFKIVGDLLRPDSRWKDVADPLKLAGIEISERKSQFS